MYSDAGPDPSAVPIHVLHPFACRCRNGEETRRFYEDLLGLPLVHVIRADTVYSAGAHSPCVSLFGRLGDDTAAAPSPNTPGWVGHVVPRVGSLAELPAAQQRLHVAGVEVIGPTDHRIIRSTCFFDPSGLRLELTLPTVDESGMQPLATPAQADLAARGA